ncbi:hypothetical protein MKX01_009053 [Papaver californicum]|nr:hypothetical protein MKX01_009053 [Papaver californicum]
MSSTTTKSLCVQLKDEIEITDTEEQVFDRLSQVVHHYNLQTQLRVAGGWVRDKLLGQQSVDIDIALHNMTGEDFCQKLNEYSLFVGEKKQKITIVGSNPDKSKHLKTAVMEVFGIKVDFVNLRSETYNQNSRIPRVEFGSPGEDAFRRDLTINSLFYNIKEKIVEDYTGRGLLDLRSGKIVTPLPPMVTFLDDPLRVFRAIRFAARFSFILDDGLREAAASEEVRNAIAGKISRERIGHEISLMLSGNQPVQAMMDICNMRLFWVVFATPDTSEPEGCDRLCVASVDAAWNLLKLVGCSIFDDDQRLLYLYSTLFLPVRDIVYRCGKGKKNPVTSYIIRESLGLTVSDVEMVKRLHSGSKEFISLIPSLNEDLTSTAEADNPRVLAGLLLRDIEDPFKKKRKRKEKESDPSKEKKDSKSLSLWRVALLISTLSYPKDSAERRTLFTRVENAIMKLGLEKVWKVPLVNGNEIMKILQLKGGSVVGEWQQKLLKWQLAGPSRTSEQSLEYMRESLSKCSELD